MLTTRPASSWRRDQNAGNFSAESWIHSARRPYLIPQMTELAFVRTFLLIMAVLAFLTATVLDGVTMRYMTQPILRRVEALSGGTGKYPPGIRFLLENAWARRLYHAAFAAIMVGLWWYLGTPAGMAMLRPAH